MREQHAINESAADNFTHSLNGSSQSLTTSCCTAVEAPPRLPAAKSPLKGYRCDSECNPTGSDYSQSPSTVDEESEHSSLLTSTGHHSSYKDFMDSLCDTSPASNHITQKEISDTVMSESMFNSSMSIKSEELQERVRRICQSTTELDEKMRLARLESSYIQVP